MASINEVQAIVIDPMLALYRPPRAMPAPQQVEALKIYTQHLTGFSVTALRAGWDNLVRTHKAGSWPTVAEIIDAVTATMQSSPTSSQSAGEYRERQADAFMRTALGRFAADNMVGDDCWQQILQTGRAPTEQDVRRMLRVAPDAMAAARDLRKTPDDPLCKTLLKIWDAMERRNERLREKYGTGGNKSVA